MRIVFMVTPVILSPFSTAHWIGAAPRYFGSKEPCTLMHPRGGMFSTRGGRIFPYAATTMSSGASAFKYAISSSLFLNVVGWRTSILCAIAVSFTGGGSSLCPLPFGLSGWV